MTHRQETEGQIQRLEEVFKLVDSAPRGKKCEAIEGILAEAKEHMAEIRTAPHSTKLEPGVTVVLVPYLAQIVSQRAAISQQEAERRVDQAFNAAREAADKARRAGVLTGFVTAASLVLSLGAAWWAAMRGGHHRDHSIPARFTFDQRRRTPPTT